jgi:uncharacterized protein YukE
MQGFSVDPSSLVTAGKGFEQLASRLESESAAVRSAGVNAERAAGNGLAGGGIHEFTGSWERVVRDLSRALTDDGRRLCQNAAAYQQTDAEWARSLQRLHPDAGQ